MQCDSNVMPFIGLQYFSEHNGTADVSTAENHKNLVNAAHATTSTKNSRDHGSYHSFYIIPRQTGNAKNCPNLVRELILSKGGKVKD